MEQLPRQTRRCGLLVIACWVLALSACVKSEQLHTFNVKINTGTCIPEYQTFEQENAIGPHHMRFYYWTLPKELVDKLMAICGQYHGIWDGFGMDGHPFGLHVRRHTRHTRATLPQAAKECTFGRLYDTNQYAIGPLWRQQMLASPLRVDKVEDADVVLVDLVDDNCMSEDSDFFHLTADLSRQALKFVLEHLDKTGKPHIVPLSKYEKAYFTRNHGGALMVQDGAERLTYINYEITDLDDYGIQMPGRAPNGNMRNFTYYNVIPTPHPSTLHMYAHDRYFSKFLLNSKNEELPDPSSPRDTWPCYLARKELLAAGSFSARYPVRKELKRQCLAAGPQKCHHVETYYSYDFVNIMQQSHDAYGRAWFCLMPHGDTHSRRSFVDCLLQDSIPVLFRQFTFDTIPFSDVISPSEYVVSLPWLESSLDYLGSDAVWQQQNKDFHVLPEAKDILGMLERQYPIEVRMKMVTNIFKVKHLYQAMLDPVHEVVRFDQLNEVHCLEDSFTGTLKATLRNLCRRGQIPEARCRGKLPRFENTKA